MKLPTQSIRNRLIILDRDGVINQDRDDYIKTAEEWIPLPGSLESMARLFKSGFTLTVATNQSGLGRKMFSLQALEAMHEKMNQLLAKFDGRIDAIAYCPHVPDDGCDCRKPKTGLIRQIEKQVGLSAKDAFFVGDKQSDIGAAITAGCTPILVRTGKGRKTERKLQDSEYPQDKIFVFEDLKSFADSLLNQL